MVLYSSSYTFELLATISTDNSLAFLVLHGKIMSLHDPETKENILHDKSTLRATQFVNDIIIYRVITIKTEK